MHAVQLLALVLLAAFLLWCAATRFPPSLAETLDIAQELGWESSFLFTGVASLAALLVIVPAVRLRVGPRMREEFGLSRLTGGEALWVVAAVAPLGILSDQLYLWAVELTIRLAQRFPFLELVPRIDSIQLIQRQLAETPYPILLVAIALAPALSEEFVFRGLIGRGLIARQGVPLGILLTSLLFACAHGTPAHALATFPVGLYLHFVYRATGKLWAAVLLHALQNALSVTLMKYQVDPATPVSAALLCASAGYLAVVGTLLWEATRARRSPEGTYGLTTPGPLRQPAQLRPVAALRVAPPLATGSIVTFTAVVVGSRLAFL